MKFKKPEIIKISTSAGGGKTYKLSERYIELLKNNASYHKNIYRDNLRKNIAITFTNKAAGEMKERILELLKKEYFSRNKDSKKQREVEKLIETILYNYSDFSVRTIDSFINTLVKSFYIDLELPPETELVINSDYYKDYALSLLIDRVEEDETLLDTLISYFLYEIQHEQKTSWYYRIDLKKGMEDIEEYERYKDIDFKDPGIDIDSEIAEIHSKFHKNAAKFAKYLEANAQKTDTRKTGGFLENYDKIENLVTYKLWEKDLEYLFKKGKEPESRSIRSLFAIMKKQFQQYFFLKALRDNIYNIRIYSRYKEILEKVKKGNRIRFIEDLDSELDKIYEKWNNNTPFIYYRYGERFRHYLIDEFQDTSKKQWEALKPLIENTLSEAGGSLFIVGDPKQAIYQWRGGEVELFEKAPEHFKSVEDINTVQLNKNYRSAPNIVDFVGDVFSDLPEDIINLLENNKSRKSYYVEDKVKQTTPAKNEKNWEDYRGFVSVKNITTNSGLLEEIHEEVKRELLITLPEILERFSMEDITILVRKNAEARKIVEWLTEESYNVISNESLYLSGDENIQALLSFLKFLQHPVDNVAFYGFITSSMFTSRSGHKYEDFKKWAEKNREEEHLYLKFRDDYNEIWKSSIQSFFVSAGFLPLYDLLNDIISLYGIPENFPKSNPYIERLLEFVHNLEKNSKTSITALFEEWEERESSGNPLSILLPEDTNAIQVMTMHSAKGLEFPVVIVPFLYFDNEKDRGKILIDYMGNKFSIKLEKGSSGYIYPEYEPQLREKMKQKIERKSSDFLFQEINNLYVALTRAMYELHIFKPDETGKKPAEWKSIIEKKTGKENYSMGKPVVPSVDFHRNAEKNITHLVMKTENRKNIESIKDRLLLKKTRIEPILDKNIEKSYKFGNAVHKALYYVKDINELENIDGHIEKALEEYIPEKEMDFYRNRLKSTIDELFKNKDVEKFFIPGQEVWREKELVDGEGNLLRPDRVIIEDEEIHIVDFKSGHEDEEEYQKQLNKYSKALSNYYPGKQTRTHIIEVVSNRVISYE